MQESKRGALTVNALMENETEDETEDEIEDETEDEMEDETEDEEHSVFVSHESARAAFVVVGC
jgi:hypothetical protein